MELSPAMLATLQKLPLFQDLFPTHLKRLFSTCTQVSFETGELLCKAGSTSDQMFILLSGSVGIRSPRGMTLTTEEALTTIGETGLLTGEQRSATVVAEEPVTALAIPRRPLMQLMQQDSALAIHMYRNSMVIVRQKLIAADRRLEEVLQQQLDG